MSKKTEVKLPKMQGRNQRTARAGEYYVAAELNCRGAYAVTFTGNMPKVDVLASNVDRSRTVYVQVKTKRSGTWQTREGEGMESPSKDDDKFWVFVALDESHPPSYWIVPEWWIRKDIYEVTTKWRKQHGGVRPRNSDSTHHQINEQRIKGWEDKWDSLKIFSEPGIK